MHTGEQHTPSAHENLNYLRVDLISAVEFNGDGDFFATGDRGGRVVIFTRVR